MDCVDNRYKRLRVLLGLSQTEIAEILGMHQTAWGRFETGKVPDPRGSTIAHICKTFGVSADWLLGISEEESPTFHVRVIKQEDGSYKLVPDSTYVHLQK